MHVMIDIETLGVKHTAPVLTIAAVFFEPYGDGPATPVEASQFHWVLNRRDQMAGGALIEVETLEWWLNQGEEARKAAFAIPPDTPLTEQLQEIQGILAHPEVEKVWANSPSFDLVILRSLFERTGVGFPYMFWEEMDVRTVRNLLIAMPSLEEWPAFEGDQHNALHDALYQVKLVQMMYRMLKR